MRWDKWNKGQISLFIIFAFVIVLGAALFFYMGGPVGSPISGNYESRAVNTFVESCFESTLEEGIYYVSFQGGYYDAPELSRKDFDLTVPYYWHSYEDSMPSLETIEQELGKYMEKNIQNCLKGFEPFQALGYDIEYDSPKITVDIIEGAVMADINFPITIKATDRVTKLQKFRARKEIDLIEAYSTAKKTLEEQKKTPNSIPAGFLVKLAYENGFTFETILLSDDDVHFALIFNEDSGRDLVFSFISQYYWTEKAKKTDFRLGPLPAINITDYGIIDLEAHAVGYDVRYSSSSDIIWIDQKSGSIEIDPSQLKNSRYNILITAEDHYGNKDSQFLNLNVDLPEKIPHIEPIGNLSAKAGEPFYYKVNATDPSDTFLILYDESFAFNIDGATGEISFTPEKPMNITTRIIAVNFYGSTYEYMRLEVK